jgi:hypothetical protein
VIAKVLVADRRAAERDEAVIVRWVAEDWPRIEANARRRKARIVFFDESGASRVPRIRSNSCGPT